MNSSRASGGETCKEVLFHLLTTKRVLFHNEVKQRTGINNIHPWRPAFSFRLKRNLASSPAHFKVWRHGPHSHSPKLFNWRVGLEYIQEIQRRKCGDTLVLFYIRRFIPLSSISTMVIPSFCVFICPGLSSMNAEFCESDMKKSKWFKVPISHVLFSLSIETWTRFPCWDMFKGMVTWDDQENIYSKSHKRSLQKIHSALWTRQRPESLLLKQNIFPN